MMPMRTKTVSVRAMDLELWQKARVKALAQRLTMRELLERLLREWVKQ